MHESNINACGDKKRTPVKLELWDTAGQEAFNSMNASYFRQADAAIFVYEYFCIFCKMMYNTIFAFIPITGKNKMVEKSIA